MVDNAALSKVLKDAMKGGKSTFGAKESIAAMKGSKGVLCTRSLPENMATKLKAEAEKHGIPVVQLTQTSAELAKMVGRPYKVSAIALRGVTEAEVQSLLR